MDSILIILSLRGSHGVNVYAYYILIYILLISYGSYGHDIMTIKIDYMHIIHLCIDIYLFKLIYVLTMII